MTSISDTFITQITQVIYGEEATKHDKQNVKRKIMPAFDGNAGLTIRDPIQARDFLEWVYSQSREIPQLYNSIASLKTNIKILKDNPIPQEWMDKHTNLIVDLENIRKEINELKKDKIMEYNTHPYCKDLLQKNTNLQAEINNITNEYNKKNIELEKDKAKYLEYVNNYAEKVVELDEEFEKKKKSFINKARQLNKEEESVRLTNIKAELASIKKKYSKLEKKNKKLKKENKQLQLRVVEMSSDDSDSDSDTDDSQE